MSSRCKRCIIDAINGFHHGECYTCHLRERRIKTCVVCFKSINNNKQLCNDCVYVPTCEITNLKKKLYI